MKKKLSKVDLALNERALIILLCAQKISEIEASKEAGRAVELYIDNLEQIIRKMEG